MQRKLMQGYLPTFLILGFAVLSGWLDASAQGRYVGQYSKGDVSNIIKRMEDSSDQFRTDFRRQLNNSNLSGSAKSRFNGYVANCENAIDALRRNFDRQNSWWESRSQVQNTINASQQVNNMMNELPFRRNLERQWNRLRNDINKVADTYDLPGLDGGGWNGGGGPGWGGGGGQPSRPPNWAEGTFYGTAPTGAQITLTISPNGQVTANIGGSMSYGTYNRGIMTIGYNSSRVNRLNNGIQTVSTSNGETINYSRSGWGGGGGGNSNPPNWAIGSFRAQNPQNGTAIFLTVERNGNVTVNMGGNFSYGSMNGSLLTMGSNTARVYRQGNGFRTVSTTDGQTIYYTRN